MHRNNVQYSIIKEILLNSDIFLNVGVDAFLILMHLPFHTRNDHVHLVILSFALFQQLLNLPDVHVFLLFSPERVSELEFLQ